jgi:hypothetical protein
METIKLKTHVGSDGILKLEVPVNVRDADLEIVVVMQPSETPVNELGWPVGFFEETYGSLADDPIERPSQGEYEVRDEVL